MWNPQYCGCCGRNINPNWDPKGEFVWCKECVPHLKNNDVTWFHQFGSKCPFSGKRYKPKKKEEDVSHIVAPDATLPDSAELERLLRELSTSGSGNIKATVNPLTGEQAVIVNVKEGINKVAYIVEDLIDNVMRLAHAYANDMASCRENGNARAWLNVVAQREDALREEVVRLINLDVIEKVVDTTGINSGKFNATHTEAPPLPGYIGVDMAAKGSESVPLLSQWERKWGEYPICPKCGVKYSVFLDRGHERFTCEEHGRWRYVKDIEHARRTGKAE